MKFNYSVTYNTEHDIYSWSKQWKEIGGGDSYWNSGTREYMGVAILIRRHIKCNITLKYQDKDGRIISILLEKDYKIYSKTNVYTPNLANDKSTFLTKLTNSLINLEQQLMFVAGDFNCARNSTSDRYHENNDIGNAQFKTLIENNDLENIWRIRLPTGLHLNGARQIPELIAYSQVLV